MDEDGALPPLAWIRVYGLILGGVPVCAAIVTFALAFTGYELIASSPFAPRGDLLEVWVVAALASVVLAIAIRAWRRTRSTKLDASVFLARVVPVLVLLGVVLGVCFARSLIVDGIHGRIESETSLCQSVISGREFAFDADPALVERCLPAARKCEEAKPKGESLQGAHYHPDFDQRPEVLCLRAIGRTEAWLPRTPIP
jgi:hypothetical protein